MDKKTILEEVCKSKIVAIFRGIDPERCSEADDRAAEEERGH